MTPYLMYSSAHEFAMAGHGSPATTVWATVVRAEDLAKDIKKAVVHATLDRPGTKPFHLKVTVAPEL